VILDVLAIIAGLALLLGGGDRMVKGASVVARNLGVSPLVVGLTVIAFGTSAPELVVNILAASRGNTGISFGNILGSNIANIGLVLATAALIRPLKVGTAVVVSREIPMMLLGTFAVAIMGADRYLRNTPGTYDRTDGLLLLLFFSVFLYYTVAEVFRQRDKDLFVDQVQGRCPEDGRESTWLNLIWLVGGMVCLLLGGHLTVTAAVALAEALGVTQAVIGLTIVAIGTSLPELITCVVASWRGQTDLAMGNVVGSNIFNLLFILGTSASIHPVPVPAGGQADLLMVLLLSVILLPVAISGEYTVKRMEGAVLLFAYVAFVAWRSLG
jgi:cation:H+ antiporter